MPLNRRQFLQGSTAAAGLVVTAPIALGQSEYGATAADGGDPGNFVNWAGNIRARPESILVPGSLHELQDSVGRAQRVKAVGSGHSFSACAHTQATMIKTDGLHRILGVDSATRRVKVEAGKKLYELNDELSAMGLAFPSLGDIDRQSVAGLISTGTHGTGMNWGSLSDAGSVHGVEIVLADGSLMALSMDRPDDIPALNAARLGLGALGVIYSVTFNLVEAHSLEMHARLMSLDEALDPRHFVEHDHFEFFRFPFTDKVQMVTRNRTEQPADEDQLKDFFNEIVVENVAMGSLLQAASWHPQSIPRVMALMASLVPDERRIDRSDRIMTSPRWVRAFEIEYALPIAQAAAMHARYGEICAAFAARGEDAYFANYPMETRFTRGDQGNLLSPTQGQDTCWFAVQSHTAFAGYEPFFRAIEDAMLSLGGRPHWGKQFYRNPVALYPKFGEFLAWRKRWDPAGKLINEYLERLMAGEELPGALGPVDSRKA